MRKTFVYKFKLLLLEGEVYQISYFGVGESTRYFRTTRQKYKLNFQLRTTVRPCKGISSPLYGIKLVSFEDILKMDVQSPYLVGKLT